MSGSEYFPQLVEGRQFLLYVLQIGSSEAMSWRNGSSDEFSMSSGISNRKHGSSYFEKIEPFVSVPSPCNNIKCTLYIHTL